MKEKKDSFRIGGEPVSKIVDIASQIVEASVKVSGNEAPDRQGGYLVIRERDSGFILLLERIGKCPPADVARYLDLAQEKGLRIASGQDISSWQSRSPETGKFGGAIVVGNLTIAFSGLKESIDEAVVLVLALRASLGIKVTTPYG
ncbi:MAG: hypothetical protein WA063_07600 [Minisyncoccia bacterium]